MPVDVVDVFNRILSKKKKGLKKSGASAIPTGDEEEESAAEEGEKIWISLDQAKDSAKEAFIYFQLKKKDKRKEEAIHFRFLAHR